MGKMKELFEDAVNEAMDTIATRMDGEAETYITQELEDAVNKIYEAMAQFAIIREVLERSEEFYPEDELWERCLLKWKDFADTWYSFEEIEDMVD